MERVRMMPKGPGSVLNNHIEQFLVCPKGLVPSTRLGTVTGATRFLIFMNRLSISMTS
jgi:hypothetical protein